MPYGLKFSKNNDFLKNLLVLLKTHIIVISVSYKFKLIKLGIL